MNVARVTNVIDLLDYIERLKVDHAKATGTEKLGIGAELLRARDRLQELGRPVVSAQPEPDGDG
jgi:hypothetical protein